MSKTFDAPLCDGRLHHVLTQDGYAFLHSAEMRGMLERVGPLTDWDDFAASWDGMPLDGYMADLGRYRRRRHAVYTIGAATADGAIKRAEHQPHYQSVDYNPLNGGVARWYEPIPPSIGEGSSMLTVLGFCRDLFGGLAAPGVRSWHVEVHQFRIEARQGEEGRPTPEGMHRDGVDYVLVLLIRRRNIASGTTTIHAYPGRQLLGSFTLTDPFDAALVDDSRVYHGVTPVEPLDPALPAYRDVLVVTFRRQSLAAASSGIP
jgi:hypothetical protein